MTDKGEVNKMDTTSTKTYAGNSPSSDGSRQATFVDVKGIAMSKKPVIITTKAVAPSIIKKEMADKISALALAGKFEQARKLAQERDALKVRNRSANGASDASLTKYRVPVTLSAAILKTDGFLQVIDGKAYRLPTGTQSNGAQFRKPGYKEKEVVVPVKTSPVKKAVVKKAVVKTATSDTVVA
jgi:hypothetical protein